MKDTLYLVVNRHGVERMCKTASFTLKSGERAVRVDVEVPDEVFAPPLLPTVRLVIPRDAITELMAEVSYPALAAGEEGQ